VSSGLFRFLQFEVPFALGPSDGRWLLRSPSGEQVQRVIVLRTVGARRADESSRRRRPTTLATVRPADDRLGAAAEVDPLSEAVQIARATVIDPNAVENESEAHAWLVALDPEAAASDAVNALNRLLAAHRISAADPHARELHVADALVLRAGFGEGEQVADGRWHEALTLHAPQVGRRARRKEANRQVQDHERVAALLSGRSDPLLCEELALRARLDLDQDRPRLAAIELERCFAAAAAELRISSIAIEDRLVELDRLRPRVRELADAALAGEPLHSDQESELRKALERLEATLRASQRARRA
jgi:hypothetical protein